MRKKSFESFVKELTHNYFETFYSGKFKLSELRRLSNKDQRLAELCQVYYLSLNSDKHKYFKTSTNLEFSSFDEYKKLNTKYMYEYNQYLNSVNNLKETYRKKILNDMKIKNVTFYRASKLVNTNQSNVSKFFNGDNNALSEEKLRHLLKKLKEVNNFAIR